MKAGVIADPEKFVDDLIRLARTNPPREVLDKLRAAALEDGAVTKAKLGLELLALLLLKSIKMPEQLERWMVASEHLKVRRVTPASETTTTGILRLRLTR